MVKAQSQCLGVMGELGRVYHHARDVLDRINPERWAAAARAPGPPPQQQEPGPGHPARRRRRQLPAGFGDIDPPHRCVLEHDIEEVRQKAASSC